MSEYSENHAGRAMTGFGARLVAMSVDRGYADVESLADAIATKYPKSRITASRMLNLEWGEQADISVSELLQLCQVLECSPLDLIANLRRPFTKPDMYPEIASTNKELADIWHDSGEVAFERFVNGHY